jgi:hypothetical protein
MRYVLGVGAQWPEPIAILLMVIFTFIGAAAAYRAGGHIAVTMLTDRLPPAVQARAARVVAPADARGVPVRARYGAGCASRPGPVDGRAALAAGGRDLPGHPAGRARHRLFVLEHLLSVRRRQRAVVTPSAKRRTEDRRT